MNLNSPKKKKNIKTINLPRSADWFTDDFKLDLQTAVKNDSPYALFPINDRALAPPSGVTTIIPPKMESFIIKKYKDKKNVRLDYDDDGKFLGVSENQDGVFRRVLFAEPNPTDVNRASSYRDLYKRAIKQTKRSRTKNHKNNVKNSIIASKCHQKNVGYIIQVAQGSHL